MKRRGRRMWEVPAARAARAAAAAIVCLLAACRNEPPASGDHAPPPATAARPVASADPTARAPEQPPARAIDLPTRVPAPRRIVAIGDVHGDLKATRAALQLAGAIDEHDAWIGGDLVVVQTGDQLDRGDDEQAILDLFERIADQAKAAGGAVHVLNGNHEIMNAVGDLRYVTPGGLADFTDVPGLRLDDPALADVPASARARMAAFRPGGPYARILAERNTVVIVGDTVFVHGGVLPKHVPEGVQSLERLNADTRAWLLDGKTGADTLARDVMAPDGVVWTRDYSTDTSAAACADLQAVLDALDAKRMVVGHTVQAQGITSACDDGVWRIDVGLAAHYGGRTQVLEIEGGRVQALGPP